MIYVISGVAKAGKTFISEKVKERYCLSVFTTDYIMMMLHKGNEDLNIDIVASDSSVAKKLEPYVYGLLETMVQNNIDYLIEGVHFNTDFSRKLIDDFGDSIKIIYLGYKDSTVENKVAEIHRFKDVMDNPWIFVLTGDRVEETVEYLIDESRRIYEECKELDLEYIEVSNICDQTDEIIDKLAIKKRT